MTLLVRRFLADYARTATNLLLLVLIPVVFVVVAADAMSDAAPASGVPAAGPASRRSPLGRRVPRGRDVLPGLLGRDTDRRLVLAGLARSQPRHRQAGHRRRPGRPGQRRRPDRAAPSHRHRPAGARGGRNADVRRDLPGLRAIVGATVPNPVNGTLLLLFIWIIDVFFGPTLSASQSP